MTEQQTPVLTPPVQPTAPKGPKKKHKGRGKTIAGIIVAAAVAIALIVLVWYFVFRDTTALGDPMTTTVYRGSIQSTVEGYGLTKAKDSATITPGTGTILELFVQEGDQVTAGQQLYRMDDTVARDAVADAQETVDNCQKELEAVYEKVAELNIAAPHAGNLREVADIQVGDTVSEGTTIAKLVNDTKLRLSLYYSYAYENQIHVGQSAKISIPAVMGEWNGTVEQINKVRFVSPEGAIHFEVVLSLDNPGTLTEGMDASAGITAADGTAIYPYQNGETEYYEVRKIVTESQGPVLSQNLLRYANVNAGDPLLVMGSDTIDSDIRAKQKEIDDATTKLTEAQKALANFNATAPIDGTVTSCTLTPGAEVKSGDTVITISNNTNMVVQITVDDRNISFVQPGMTVDLTDYNGNVFVGTVSSIDMSIGENSSNGMTSYPVTLDVDNSAGTLLAGMWLDYSFVASQSDQCVVVPMQAVKYVSDADGNTSSVVFIQADEKPENAVELDIPEVEPGQTPTYPTEADGYYPVPVTTGLSDNYNVEIKEGLQGGETVFVNYYVDQGSSWG